MAISEKGAGEISGGISGETPCQELVVLDIQRMSTEDGPGLRTTVFFKGCNLACPWCHNPESIGIKSDLAWFKRKCMGCNICQNVCPQKGISRNESGISFNRPLCLACGTCVNECPNGAIELKGSKIPVKELAEELVKDKAYFGSEGGITLSGGEAMIQHKAVNSLAQLLKSEGLHVAIDTAGSYDFSILEPILPFIDLVLYDIKIYDSEAHKHFTGTDNSLILENFKKLMKHQPLKKIWVRTPIIKGASDSEENIAAIGKFIASNSTENSRIERWELCAFNNLCLDKYERLDLEWKYKDIKLTEKSHIEKLTRIAASYIPGAVYTGAVQGENYDNIQK